MKLENLIPNKNLQISTDGQRYIEILKYVYNGDTVYSEGVDITLFVNKPITECPIVFAKSTFNAKNFVINNGNVLLRMDDTTEIENQLISYSQMLDIITTDFGISETVKSLSHDDFIQYFVDNQSKSPLVLPELMFDC